MAGYLVPSHHGYSMKLKALVQSLWRRPICVRSSARSRYHCSNIDYVHVEWQLLWLDETSKKYRSSRDLTKYVVVGEAKPPVHVHSPIKCGQ